MSWGKYAIGGPWERGGAADPLLGNFRQTDSGRIGGLLQSSLCHELLKEFAQYSLALGI